MVSQFKKNKKRNSKKNIFFSILIGTLLVLVIGFFIVTNLKINQRRTELTNRAEILRQEILILEQKNEELKDKISQAKSEEYLEKAARDQLDMKAPGEEVVVISQEEGQKKQEEIEEEKSWWDKIKSIWAR